MPSTLTSSGACDPNPVDRQILVKMEHFSSDLCYLDQKKSKQSNKR